MVVETKHNYVYTLDPLIRNWLWLVALLLIIFSIIICSYIVFYLDFCSHASSGLPPVIEVGTTFLEINSLKMNFGSVLT